MEKFVMNKAFGASVFLMLVSAIALSEIDDYFGSWAFYALGTIMVTVAYLRKGDAIYFWAGIFIMGVTFGAANITSEIYRETSDMYQEATGSTESSE
jgi:hypothetical protein